MIKTLKNLFKQDKEKFVVPKSVQSVIPIKTIWEDGVFLVGKNKYAKTFKFEDINYAVASREDKEAMFLEYSELLNALDSGATTKITINNRRLNKADFVQTILISMADDGLDKYRKEYNKMLLDKATGANSIVQDKYVTVSVCKKNIEEARNYFARVGADLIGHFNRLGSKCVELDAGEKLRIFHDFYRTGEETGFAFDMLLSMQKGHDFKDYICPDSFEFEKDCFRIGNRYGRVIFLREYAAYIKDSMVAELCEMNRNMMLSVDVVPVPTDEAVREVENRLLGVETNITNWQRKQNQNNNFSAVIPYDLEQQRKESKEFLDDLTTRDQRMMFAVLTMVHTAETKEQLDNDTEALLTTARKHLCQFAVLKYQQMDGLNTALPFGVRKIDALRTLTTESLAVFIPFRVQEIYHENGVYYGQNVISKNMIIANRRHLLNGNSFILGVSGAGKSFTAKEEMTNIILTDPNVDVIIIDPEREYSPLVKAMQGEVIHISATSESHINAMDMNSDYGDGANPVILKSEFILSLCEQLIGGNSLGAKQKSIIDRCTASVYRYYQQGNYMGTPPTLQDFREELLKQNEPEAQEIALAIELFTDGSLNTFAKHTNVDTKSRLICYDILDLGKQLQPIGMLVVLDSILNRITQNRAKYGDFYVNAPDELERIMAEVEEIEDVDWDNCTLTRYDNDYQNAKESLAGLQNIVFVAIAVVSVICFLVLALFLTLRLRGRVHETGVYLAMGISKGAVLMQYLLEVLIVAVIALLISYGSSTAISDQIGLRLLSQVTAETYETVELTDEAENTEQPSTEDLGLSEIVVAVSAEDYALVWGFGLVLCLASTAIAAYPIMKMKPKNILSQMS